MSESNLDGEPQERCKEAKFVDDNFAKLIERVTSVMPIADELRSKDMLHGEKYDEIKAEKTNQEKMRKLFESLNCGGDTVKKAFYYLLEKDQPQLFKDLGGVSRKRKLGGDHESPVPCKRQVMSNEEDRPNLNNASNSAQILAPTYTNNVYNIVNERGPPCNMENISKPPAPKKEKKPPAPKKEKPPVPKEKKPPAPKKEKNPPVPKEKKPPIPKVKKPPAPKKEKNPPVPKVKKPPAPKKEKKPPAPKKEKKPPAPKKEKKPPAPKKEKPPVPKVKKPPAPKKEKKPPAPKKKKPPVPKVKKPPAPKKAKKPPAPKVKKPLVPKVKKDKKPPGRK
ncbi:hypothetical protein R3I94_005902 [Phoxinus phoxinus]